jgi:hypothetical protein
MSLVWPPSSQGRTITLSKNYLSKAKKTYVENCTLKIFSHLVGKSDCAQRYSKKAFFWIFFYYHRQRAACSYFLRCGIVRTLNHIVTCLSMNLLFPFSVSVALVHQTARPPPPPKKKKEAKKTEQGTGHQFFDVKTCLKLRSNLGQK